MKRLFVLASLFLVLLTMAGNQNVLAGAASGNCKAPIIVSN